MHEGGFRRAGPLRDRSSPYGLRGGRLFGPGQPSGYGSWDLLPTGPALAASVPAGGCRLARRGRPRRALRTPSYIGVASWGERVGQVVVARGVARSLQKK